MSTKRSKSKRPKKAKKPRATISLSGEDKPRCGLCGKRGRLIRTECCGQWICDDEHEYELFSYARNSCSRNHRRYTLCGVHHSEGHDGSWKDCQECKENIEPEMYVYYGTNEYNFEKLEDIPEYEPTKCLECGAVIVMSEGGFSKSMEGYSCFDCTAKRFGGFPGFHGR